ncbi:MAG: T9SS type A sorting domain-containing protein [Candidatus Kapabacteria bacterium]|nr:T9SS type A sorting domain-containing protein [Candidatus Kapabacteria bacterium]
MNCRKHFFVGLNIVVVMLLSGLNISFGDESENGRKFYMTFLPNFHNNKWSQEQQLKYGDSLYIIIYADTEPTNGTITYSDNNSIKNVHSFTIPNPDIPHIFSIAYNKFELIGYNDAGRVNNNSDNEKISKKSFYIETDKNVIVLGHNQAYLTSESFNVLPEELLAEDYIVMAYNSNGISGPPPGVSNSLTVTPSQFAIIATEDNTVVDIFPSAPTYANRLNPQRITLDRSDVYLVQAYGFQQDRHSDLTGTEVRSDKPIAIVAGQQRARVAFDLPQQDVSRDMLMEQMPPIKYWNMSFPVIPLPDPVSQFDSRHLKDKLRVLAAFDGTELLVGDVLIAQLDKGEYYETDIIEPFMLNSTAPVLPMIYRRSAQLSNMGNSVGDPLMQIVPSIDQFSNRQKFYSLEVKEPKFSMGGPVQHQRVYTEHFAVIISPNNNFGNITLNGTNVNTNLFKPIIESDFSYSILSVNPGTNLLNSIENVGLFVCGYGYANSYGYFTGTLRARDDWEPPLLKSSSDCFEIEGIVTDNGVKEIRVQDGTAFNIYVEIAPFTEGDTTVSFKAKIINPFLDGHFKLIASDMILQQIRKEMSIPGFTIAVNGTQYTGETIEVQKRIRSDIKYCMDYTLYNYGQFPQEVYMKAFESENFVSDFPNSVNLEPGESFTFEVCFNSEVDVIEVEDLILYNDCVERNFATMEFESKEDQYEPIILATPDPCNQYVSLKITDEDDWEWGLEEVIFENVENVEIEVTNPGVYSREIMARVIDPYQDAYFMLSVKDSSGKVASYEAILPGFTLEFEDLTLSGSSDQYEDYEFSNTMIGGLNCSQFRIKNYGGFDLDLDDVFMMKNSLFTVPQAQMPLIIKPGTSMDLTLCYRPGIFVDEIDYDTLKLTHNCIDRFVPVSGLALSIEFNEDSRCNVPLSISSSSVPNTTYLSSSTPNPTQGIAKIEFGLPQDSYVEITVYSILGQEILNLVNSELKAGHFEMDLDLNNQPSGIYIYTLQTDSTIITKTLLINR